MNDTPAGRNGSRSRIERTLKEGGRNQAGGSQAVEVSYEKEVPAMRIIQRAIIASAALLLANSCGLGGEEPAIEKRDRELGREQHPILSNQLGGAYGGPESAYVRSLGEKLAAHAGLEGECTFTLVNTNLVNAFAVPGCYIYVTRGLMAIVNSEAELASVLGHELGHIAADHLEEQERRSVLRQLGVYTVALITESETLTRIASGAAELFTLRYSRRHEYEADAFAIELLVDAGYDPYAAADMLASLEDYGRFQQGGGPELHAIPEWGRTHPLSENRVERVNERARQAGIDPEALPEREAEYMRELEGLLYGDDPEQGFVLGRVFAHPAMRIAFEVPPGFRMTNTPSAVLIEGPEGLQGEFAGGTMPPGSLDAYVGAVVRDAFGAAAVPGPAEIALVNGVPAVMLPLELRSAEGPMQALFAAYGASGGSAYHFLLLAPPGTTLPPEAMDLLRSFRLLSPAEAARLRPRVIDVIAVREGDTVASLTKLMASDRPIEHFLMLNQLSETDRLVPGEPVKVLRFATATP